MSLSTYTSTTTDADLVEAIRRNKNDQGAWRRIVKRIENPLRRRITDYLGSSAKYEDVDDAFQYAVMEILRRLVNENFNTSIFSREDNPVSLASFAKTAGAATGVRKLRSDQYGSDYKNVIVPALRIRDRIAVEQYTIEDAASAEGVTVEKARDLLMELHFSPTPMGHDELDADGIHSVASAEDNYLNSPSAMIDSITSIIPTPDARAYVVRLAGSREYIGDGAEGRDSREAHGIDEREYDRLRKRAQRDAMRFVGASTVAELVQRRERVAAHLRGEAA